MKNELLKKAGAERVMETLKRLLAGRSESYEAFFSCDSGFNVDAKDGAVEAMKVKSNSGVGIRTISGGRLGFGFSSVLTDDALEELVKNAIAGSLSASEDRFLSLPGASGTPTIDEDSLRLYDDSFFSFPEEKKIESAIKIEQAARSADPRIKRVRKATYSETVQSTWVINSNGVDLKGSATYFTGSVTAVAEQDGESQMGWEMDTSHERGRIDYASIGKGAADNAIRMLGAKKPRTVKCPAVIENTVACELLESLAGSFLGDNVIKGKSMLIGKAGKKVASSTLNVWDDGVLPGGWSSSVFDGEGALRGKTPLISEGVCRGYLYDTYWAKRAGASTTGNASRGSYKGYPSIGISNLYIEKGAKSLEELFREIGTGLFITELLGVHTINTVSGDFSLGAAGTWVEGGRAAYPVRGMAIAGNLLGLFSKIACCGSDLRFIGSIGSPSLLVEEIEASGE